MWVLTAGTQHGVHYGLSMTCKLNSVCGYSRWTWGWAPRWGLLWLLHFLSFPPHQIYWQSMDKPPGPLYSALDLLGYPGKRKTTLRMTDSDECDIKMKCVLLAFWKAATLTDYLESSIKLKTYCSDNCVMNVTVYLISKAISLDLNV